MPISFTKTVHESLYGLFKLNETAFLGIYFFSHALISSEVTRMLRTNHKLTTKKPNPICESVMSGLFSAVRTNKVGFAQKSVRINVDRTMIIVE